MKIYFEKHKYPDRYTEIKEFSKKYIYEKLKEQHAYATESISNYKKYKKKIKSLDDLPDYKRYSSNYKYIHSLNVADKCRKMAIKEGKVSEEIMELIGLFHDISHYSCDYKFHGQRSGEMAKEFLKKYNIFSEEELNNIQKIIEAHYPVHWDEEYYLGNEISMEEIILLECDFWDKVDLESYSKKTKIIDDKRIEKAFNEMQEKIELLLNLPKDQQECVYTSTFLRNIEMQGHKNKEYLKERNFNKF